MKKLLLLLFLIPNLVMGQSVKYICSNYAESSPFYEPESNNYETGKKPSEWRAYPKETLLIEINYDEETITTRSFSGKNKHQDIYKLIIPQKKKYYIDSHVSGYLIDTQDGCAEEYKYNDEHIEHAKNNNYEPMDFPISDGCKYIKNSAIAISNTILFNVKKMRFIRSWLHEGELPKSIMQAQINYGSCQLDR
jgi:hypothetical protein